MNARIWATAGISLAAAMTVGVLSLPDRAESQQTCTSAAGGAAAIRIQADAFLATLNPAQREAAVRPYDRANAIKWSNLPVNMAPRHGVRFGDMNPAQQQAANALIATAMSSCGKQLFDEVRGADAVLNKLRPQQWDPGSYFVAFAGAPSATTPWVLQVTGHHLAYNIAFNGREVSATPLFDGIEPVRYELDGKTYEPLAVQKNAVGALATALATKPAARLPGEFRDVTRGATNQGDTNFPVTFPTGAADRGIPYAQLSAVEKALVRRTMEAWVLLPNEAISRPLMQAYVSDAALAETYVGFAGQTDMAAAGGYLRIDGPRLWIEFVVQRAASAPDGVHFHTIWRDKTADYGGAFRTG